MAHFTDLHPCTYFPFQSDRLLAAGWLEQGQPFAIGHVDRNFVDRLAELLVEPWAPVTFAGPHACTLCRFSGGPTSVSIGDRTIAIGVNNLFVPAADRVYVAPSSILHYIDAHEYAPPAEFIDAVMQCPPMRSMQYLREMARLLLRRSSVERDR